MKETAKPVTVDEYISHFSPQVQEILQQVRLTVQKAAPEATEFISYGIPAFRYKEANLVYFAAFQRHLGFYALPSGNDAFKKDLSNYQVGKGSIQFPLDAPMPLDLITRIVKFRIEEVEQKQKGK